MNQYEGELRGILLTVDDRAFPKTNTAFESVVRDLAIENIQQFYENELAWIDTVCRKTLSLAEPGKNQKNQLRMR